MPGDTVFNKTHRLIKKGDLVGLRAALEGGLDPNLKNRFGWTLLMLAAMQGRPDLAELLISFGADPKFKNQFGDSAMTLAYLKGHQRLSAKLKRAEDSSDQNV